MVPSKLGGKFSLRLLVWIVAGVASTGLLGAIGGTPTQSQARPLTNLNYGFTMALLENNTIVRGMGYQWVSYTIGWDSAEPSPGSYNWDDADNITTYAQNAQINVLMRVSRSPTWARDPACASNPTCPPTDPARFGSFMGALAAHVRPRMDGLQVAYEIWNEPNTDNEWGGICPDAARYTGLVRAAYPRIKAVHPDATVIAGSVTTVSQLRDPQNPARPTVCFIDDIQFIQGMYDAGAAPYFDVLSDHPYGYIYPPEEDPLNTTHTALVFRRAERHRDIMVQNGDAAKQIWATELGWAMDPATLGSTCPRPDWYFIFNPQEQADLLVGAHLWARSYWPWMGAMFVFNFDFSEAPWYGECDAFRFWSVKDRPAQAALAAMVQNPPPTYTPIPDDYPHVTAVRYSTTTFNTVGGPLTVELDVTDTDSSPVGSAQADVQYPDGSTQLTAFDLVTGTNQSGTWRAIINIPANNSGAVQLYTISPSVTEAGPAGRSPSVPPKRITVQPWRFSDVPTNYWAFPYIDYLANAGVIAGYNDGTFRPNNNATRGQFSKMIVLAETWPINTTDGPHFIDVPPTDVFYPYIETAANRGTIVGYNDGTFRPSNNITRAQITKIVVLAQGWDLLNPTTPTFSDVPRGSVFYPFVETAYAYNIIVGYNDGTFRPNNNATRAQLSKILYLAVTSPPKGPTKGP